MRSEPSVLHVDLDAFFAAVEQRDKPSLRGRPVIVGGLGARGVVATASYEARKQGVSSAMPMAHARARCRQAAFLVPRFRVYAETSEAIMDVLRSASVLVEPLSLDEAYVDLAAPDSPEPGPLDIDAVVARGRELKSKIRSTTGLIASVGAGTSKLVAKVASDLGKPDGLLVVAPGDETELLAPLPVSRLPGVGPATEERLRAMGVHTVSQLAAVDRAELVTQLGKAHGDQLWRLARADDPRPVDPSRVTRSISVEDTFERDVVGTSRLTAVVEEMAARIASRLRADGWTGRTITVKVRRHDFATLSRSATLPAPTDDTRTLARLPGGCSPRSTRATACACSASGSAGWPTGPRATCSRPILSQLRTRSLLPIGGCRPHRPGDPAKTSCIGLSDRAGCRGAGWVGSPSASRPGTRRPDGYEASPPMTRISDQTESNPGHGASERVDRAFAPSPNQMARPLRLVRASLALGLCNGRLPAEEVNALRSVLVTGASRGIGRAVAEAFAAAGDRVAVHHRASPDLADQVRASLAGSGHVVVQADLADPDAVRRMVDDAVAALGGLDVLVNNAAVYAQHPITATTYEQWQEAWRFTLGVNLVGTANVTWCAVQHMLRAGRGSIVNVSSRGAFRGEPRQPAYGASKAGLNAFGQSLARALAPYGISVATVAPGYVATDMAAGDLEGDRGDEIKAQSPFGRVAQPAEIAAAVVYLASPEATFASGTILDVNGASYLRT